MAFASESRDQPSREGGVVEPTDAQLEGATADGAPVPPPASAASAEPSIEEELAVERDRNLRLRAELENVRARTARELAHERRYAAQAIVRDLLPVIDNVDRAIAASEQRPDGSGLLDGFRMLRQQLETVLAQHHCIVIPADGQAFDPQLHDAILQQPSDDVPAGHVMQVTQIGYQLHDRVIRPSQVIVSAGPQAP